jgi:AhpD family alkylhydroperoxidase
MDMITSLDDELDAILASGKEKAAEEIMRDLESTYGEVPYVFSFMKDNPDILITKVLHNNSILRSSALDARTIELISISVAAAIRCSYCLKLHMRLALNLSVSNDQIAAAIFLAGNLVNASVLATASRQLNEKREVCQICEISSKACDIGVSKV